MIIIGKINQLFYILHTLLLKVIYKNRGVSVGNHILFKRAPRIQKLKNAKIRIGDNTVVNSSNKGYHLNMYCRCKIMADRDGAEIVIGENCRIHGSCIHALNSIKIGRNCLIAANTNIIDGNGHMLNFQDVDNRVNTIDQGRPIVIEDSVWIGANCLILGGVTIGRGSVVAAHSVVKTDIPPMSLAAGNPAKIIRDYSINNQ